MHHKAISVILFIVIVFAIFAYVLTVIKYNKFVGGGGKYLRGANYLSMFKSLGDVNPVNCMFVGENHYDQWTCDISSPSVSISEYINHITSHPDVTKVTVLAEFSRTNPLEYYEGDPVNVLNDILINIQSFGQKVEIVRANTRGAIFEAISLELGMRSVCSILPWFDDESLPTPPDETFVHAFDQIAQALNAGGRDIRNYDTYCTVDNLEHSPMNAAAPLTPNVREMLELYRVHFLEIIAHETNHDICEFLDSGFTSASDIMPIDRTNPRIKVLYKAIEAMLRVHWVIQDMDMLRVLVSTPPEPGSIIICAVGYYHARALTDFINRHIDKWFLQAQLIDAQEYGPVSIPDPAEYLALLDIV